MKGASDKEERSENYKTVCTRNKKDGSRRDKRLTTEKRRKKKKKS